MKEIEQIMLGQCHAPQPKTPQKKEKQSFVIQPTRYGNHMSDVKAKVGTPMARPANVFNFDTPATNDETEQDRASDRPSGSSR